MILLRRLRHGLTVLPLIVLTACGGSQPADVEADDDARSADAIEDSAMPASGGGSTGDHVAELMDARVIRWSVVGDYAGEELILNVGTNGYAPVTDHVELTFDYTNEGNGGLTGEPKVVNFPSEMGALRNGAEGCRAPTVSGPYEHSTIEQLKNGFGGQLTMVVRTDYPQGAVPVACTGGDQASPARSSTTETDFIVPGIGMLTMADALTGDDLRVAPDKRSFIVKRYGWTYTYTPSRVR